MAHDWAPAPALATGPLLKAFPASRLLVPPGTDRATWKPQGPGLLDLFCGSKRVSRSAVRSGLPWSLTFDLADSPDQDLLLARNQKLVLGLLAEGAFAAFCAVPASFSQAIAPAWRTARYPSSRPDLLPHQAAKVDAGNRVSQFCARVAVLAAKKGVAGRIENPSSSWLWRQPVWEPALERKVPGAILEYSFCAVDCCRFGVPWRKRTHLLTSAGLGRQRCLWTRDRDRVLLRGQGPRGKPWTLWAQPCPWLLYTFDAADDLSPLVLRGCRDI